MVILNNETWINYGRWVQPTLSGCFWCFWNETKSTEDFLGGKYISNLLFLDGNSLILLSDEKKLKQFIKGWCSSEKKTDDITQKLNIISIKYTRQHLMVLNKKDIKQEVYIQKIFKSYNEVVGMWWLCVVLGDLVQKYIIDNKIYKDEKELQAAVEQVRKDTWLEQQSKDIKLFIRQIKKEPTNIKFKEVNQKNLIKYPKIYNSIKKHVEKYSWFGTHHWMGDSYTLSKCLSQIRQSYNKDQSIKNKKTIIKTNSVAKFLAEIVYWRTHHAEVAAKVIFLARPRLTNCAKKLGISYKELTYLSHTEILKYLEVNTNNIKLPTNFQQRMKRYGCYVGDKKEAKVITGKKLYILLDKLDEKIENINVSEIKGSVASKGEKKVAKVSVLISPEDFQNFKKGDILVAPETTPDFVPFMKIASAVVTDRGGITSHAAIVSRELRIPCITGTKIATKVFKNGDLVEVDTERGIVKKIK